MTEVDFLVIGSGIAGLWFAYKAAQHGSVLVITKKDDAESATNYAQGGIAAAVGGDDSSELHYEDTVKAGCGLADPDVVRLVTEKGPALVHELHELGVCFTTYEDAHGRMQFDLGREGGHRRRRILHAQDFTGLEIERGLLGAVRSGPDSRISEEHLALDLALDRDGRCIGAHVLNVETGAVEPVRARATLLAAGGIGQAYLHTTNPPIATGDGIAMGFRAGARVANMEFIQFHPTSLHGHLVNGRAFLISEAVRGEGAILRTLDGSAFMEQYHPDGSLAPRDVVARAIDTELRQRGEEFVLLDATHLNPQRIRERFPNIHRSLSGFGIDMTVEPIPVVPAAHYVCGGVAVNERGESSVPGLLAAGECAFTGLHGANRLASNSLLEALVFADLAAGTLSKERCGSRRTADVIELRPAEPESEAEASGLRAGLRGTMWNHAGIVRSDSSLRQAWQELDAFSARAAGCGLRASVGCIEVRNLLTVARLVVACALRRPESRGLHFNKDHPESDDRFKKNTVITARDLAGAS